MKNNARAIIALGSLLFFAQCGGKDSPEESQEKRMARSQIQLSPAQLEAAQISIGALETKDMPIEVSCTGLVDAPPNALSNISVPIAGSIASVGEILPGKKVSTGQVLFQVASLDYIQMQQEYLQAKEQARFLQGEKLRQQNLNAEEVGSKKRMQQAESEAGALEAQIQALAMKLEILGCDLKALNAGKLQKHLLVRSPLDGYIDASNLSIGKVINPTEVLVSLANVQHKHIELKVFAKDLSLIKVGQQVNFESEGQEAVGKVFLVGKQIHSEERSASVHVHFNQELAEANFQLGQFVNARIQTGNGPVLRIPEGGVAREGQGAFIYVVPKAGWFEQVPVDIVRSQDQWVGIRPHKPLGKVSVATKGASVLKAIFDKD